MSPLFDAGFTFHSLPGFLPRFIPLAAGDAEGDDQRHNEAACCPPLGIGPHQGQNRGHHATRSLIQP